MESRFWIIWILANVTVNFLRIYLPFIITGVTGTQQVLLQMLFSLYCFGLLAMYFVHNIIIRRYIDEHVSLAFKTSSLTVVLSLAAGLGSLTNFINVYIGSSIIGMVLTGMMIQRKME